MWEVVVYATARLSPRAACLILGLDGQLVMSGHCPVLIVGGGPVGLLLACLLGERGITVRVLEREGQPSPHSRAIGIHPPSLELMARIGLAEELVEQGVVVRRGHAIARGRRLGTLSFETCPPPYRFVVSLPQARTERLLARRLERIDAAALRRGAEVTELDLSGERPEVTFLAEGRTHHAAAELVLGCDGKRSVVRRAAGIEFEGRAYRDAFVMGDFDDDTAHGPDAAIYLHPEGLIECFPLPGGRRRWVLAVDDARPATDRAEITGLVRRRLGHDLGRTRDHWVSAFGVEHRLARAMQRGRVALAGDAAHVVSPLGGQGMNLGWLGAGLLADAVERVLRQGAPPTVALAGYERRIRAMARRATRRAELNMALGRRPHHPALRDGIVSALLALPTRRLLARLFTMRGLERWPL